MPRQVKRPNGKEAAIPTLVAELSEEMQRDTPVSAQPAIVETQYSTGAIHLQVVWNRWADVSLWARRETILLAYEQVSGGEQRQRVKFCAGHTFAEADEAGFLTFEIVLLLRPDDPVTREQCHHAMRQIDAPTDSQGTPYLRYPELEIAQSVKKLLIDRLPQSVNVWAIVQTVFEEIVQPVRRTFIPVLPE